MKTESMVGRRIYGVIIDMILVFILVFLFDGLIFQPINKKITNIEEVRISYEENAKIYEDIQNEYNIYIYDEKGNRIYNENVTQENKDAFLNDQRIITLNEVLIEEQETILKNFAGRIAISILASSSIVFIGLPLILKEGKTIGKIAGKVIVINNNETKIKWYKSLLRGIIAILVDIYLGILTLGMIPLISLVVAILTPNNKSLVDMICKTRVVDNQIPYQYQEK